MPPAGLPRSTRSRSIASRMRASGRACRSFTWKSASPRPARRRRRLRPGTAHSTSARRAIGKAGHSPNGSNATTAKPAGSRCPHERIVLTMGASAALVLAMSALFSRGDRVAVPRPGYPGAPQRAACARPRAGRVRLRRRHALPADGGDDRRARPCAVGPHPDQPFEPDRLDDPGPGTRRHRGRLPRARHPDPVRRDLSRHHLRRCARYRSSSTRRTRSSSTRSRSTGA